MDPLTGRLLAGLAYTIAIVAALVYGCKTGRMWRMAGFSVGLGYMALIYYLMAHLTILGRDIDFLISWFQAGQILVAFVITLQIGLTYYEERRRYDHLNNIIQGGGE